MNYFLFGPSGSGKGMEVFTTFILPAFREQRPNPDLVDSDGNPLPQGREVFGNVQMDLKRIEEFLGHPVRYRFISDYQLRDPMNWPNLSDPDELGNRTVSPGRLFPSGSLIWLDEARSVWRNNESIPTRILRAVDTQRHFSTESGKGIDLVWSGTAKSHFHKDVRENGEAFYKLTSLEERGIKDAHRLTMFTDYRCSPADAVPRMTSVEIMHDKRLYGMYSSVATGVAAHHVLDNRLASSRRGPKFYVWLMAGLGIFGCVAALGAMIILSKTSGGVQSRAVEASTAGTKVNGNGQGEEAECDEPRAVFGGSRLVVRDRDGSAVAVEDDGRCGQAGGQSLGTGQGLSLGGVGL